jgi:hypothetical protein
VPGGRARTWRRRRRDSTRCWRASWGARGAMRGGGTVHVRAAGDGARGEARQRRGQAGHHAAPREDGTRARRARGASRSHPALCTHSGNCGRNERVSLLSMRWRAAPRALRCARRELSRGGARRRLQRRAPRPACEARFSEHSLRGRLRNRSGPSPARSLALRAPGHTRHTAQPTKPGLANLIAAQEQGLARPSPSAMNRTQLVFAIARAQ